MTYEQYWYGEPYLARDYVNAHKLNIERKNQELWLQGLYIYNAVGTVMSNAFRNKGSTPAKYLEQPIEIFPKQVEDTEQEAIKQREKVINSLTNWKKAWDIAKGKNNNAG